MGFQAILGLQFHGLKTAVGGTAGVALHSSPVHWKTGMAGSGQQQAGPCAAVAHMVYLYPHKSLIIQ